MKTLIAVGALILFALLGDALAAWLHFNIPGSIVGLVGLFVLLQFRVIKLEWVESGANLLLKQMLLFFVPASVGVIQYLPLMKQEGLKLVVVIAVSTVSVMLVSGGMTELLMMLRRRARRGH